MQPMTFDDWWAAQEHSQLDEITARVVWRSICSEAALLALSTAAGRDAEAIAEAILEMRDTAFRNRRRKEEG